MSTLSIPSVMTCTCYLPSQHREATFYLLPVDHKTKNFVLQEISKAALPPQNHYAANYNFSLVRLATRISEYADRTHRQDPFTLYFTAYKNHIPIVLYMDPNELGDLEISMQSLHSASPITEITHRTMRWLLEVFIPRTSHFRTSPSSQKIFRDANLYIPQNFLPSLLPFLMEKEVGYQISMSPSVLAPECHLAWLQLRVSDLVRRPLPVQQREADQGGEEESVGSA